MTKYCYSMLMKADIDDSIIQYWYCYSMASIDIIGIDDIDDIVVDSIEGPLTVLLVTMTLPILSTMTMY